MNHEHISSCRYVPRHIAHHGAHAGYDILFQHMGLGVARSRSMAWVGKHLPRPIAWRLWLLRPQATQAAGMEAELGALPWSMKSARLTHFIYGEDTYFYTPLWKSGRHRCIATYHYPPDRLIERINPGVLKSLSAVVAVGINQVDYLSRFLPEDRIFYAPHPVDADFFSPAPPPPSDIVRLICVGQMFRRHDLVLAVHRRLVGSGFPVETHVIGPKSLLDHDLNREPGIRVHVGLSDDELRMQYRSSTIGLLPLSDSTANNSLLEMMACGLPVVSTDVGGVAGYTKGSAARLAVADDVDGLCHHVEQLLREPHLRTEEGVRNRQHVLDHLSLPVAAARMFDLYDRVLAD